MTSIQPAPMSFFTNRPTTEIARDLLGTHLLYTSHQGTLGGLIVETEAYVGAQDTAAHAYNGRRTPFSEPLYHEPGTIYIYQLRGFFLFDIVTQAVDQPQGVLVRAIEPTHGLAQMQRNRPNKPGVNVTNGPGKLMGALGIHDKQLTFKNVSAAPLTIDLANRQHPRHITTAPRIGVNTEAASGQLPYRYFITGNPYVSGTLKKDWDREQYGWL